MTISLKEQVDSFAATRAGLKALLGGRKPLNNFLSKSLFLIGVGTMDLLPCCNFYISFPLRDNKTEVEHLIGMYNNTLTALHGMGARKFGIINAGLIGCMPSVQSMYGGLGGDGPCDDDLNRLAAEFNFALGTLLSDLASKLHRFRYSLADFYGFSNATFTNPSASGNSNSPQNFEQTRSNYG